MKLATLETPSLILDVKRLQRNAAEMARRISDLGANLRPHVKTHKCVEVGLLQTIGHRRAITVSTLAEARAFAARGFSDITYAVPLEPGKFDQAIDVRRTCDHFQVLTDDPEVPELLNAAAQQAQVKMDLFLKVDCGYHRCGVLPDSPAALEIPEKISRSSNLRFAGILTHAGHAYHCRNFAERLAVARQERDVMVAFAERLRARGIEVPVVSIGSTPSITAVDHLEGIDEVRPGNYIFFDAFQASIGSCSLEDCALTVLAAVVHCDARRGKLIVDAGAIALSKDRGAVEFDEHCGYGHVLSLEGQQTGLTLGTLSQEHGEIAVTDETGKAAIARLKVGSRVRILPNHSCLTAAQFSHYNVLADGEIVERWEVQRGW